MRLQNKEKVYLLLFGDLIAMLVAFVIALAIGHKPPMSMWLFWSYKWSFLVLISLVVLVFIILDVYSVHKIPDRFSRQMVGAGMGLLLVAVISTFIFFFSKRIAVPKFVFIAFFAFSFFFMFVFRYFLNKFLRSFVFWRLLLVGKKKICEEIASLINRREFLHSRIVGYLSDDAAPGSSSGFVFMGKIENLARVAKRESIDRIIVASRKIDEDMMRLLLGCMQEKIRVVDCNSLVLLH